MTSSESSSDEDFAEVMSRDGVERVCVEESAGESGQGVILARGS